MNLSQTLLDLGGSARRRDLIAAGISGSMLTRACEGGEIIRASRGVYALAGRDDDKLAALRAGTDLTCVSAALRRGLWVMRRPQLVHVAANHGRPLPDVMLVVHRTSFRVTDVLICTHSAMCLPTLDALCIIESAVVRGLVTIAELRQASQQKRAIRLREILALIDPHSESILETVARYHLVRAGLSVASQVHISGVGRLDLLVDGVLGVETDGRQFHSDRREFAEDRRRWNLLTTRGVPVLRVTRDLLFDDPDKFIDLVNTALATRVRRS